YRLYGYKLYKNIYNIAKNDFNAYVAKLSNVRRNDKRILIITSQFLSKNHAPTRRAIDYSLNLIDIGYEVMIINTNEIFHSDKSPFYFDSSISGNVEKSMSNYNRLMISENNTVLFRQILYNYENCDEIEKMINEVIEFTPSYVLSVGGSSNILSDLIAEYIPTATITTGYEIPIICNGYPVVVRDMEEKDIRLFSEFDIKRESIIRSEITFKKPDTAKKNIDKDSEKFIICVVSNRLDDEFGKKEIEICDKFLDIDSKIMIKFFGKSTDNFLINLKKNSRHKDRYIYAGFQDDILNAYRTCDVYYNPKRNGGASSLAQAMLVGLPVVCYKYGHCSYAYGISKCIDSEEGLIEEVVNLLNTDYYEISKNYSIDRAKLLFDTKTMIRKLDKDIKRKISDKVLYDIEID
ncbi:MAG: glycosyltransferase, partial [Peptoanaerobacter stomatis]|uniref:glycosyltransferase n=1 Tax=Peptoanaerobacter stomatis TaxID=796937 RepID=UPI003FA11307